MSTDGFDDLDDVLDDDGNIVEDDEDSERGEDTVGSSNGTSETIDTGTEHTSDVDRREQTEEKEQPSPDQPQQTAVQSGVQIEETPDPTVVKELASKEIPGIMSSTDRYPYAMRRSSWNDERSGNLKFVMRPETQAMEDAASAEVQEELFANTDLNITDLREAAYIIGLQNLDDVVDVLNEWGFAEQEDLHK